jgi:hypothetical protein
MNIERVKQIADAVLYEGYILYPYRASAIKNHKRFSFGTLHPASNDSGEPSTIRTQCLVIGEAPMIEVRVRFLHLVNRDVLKLESPCQELLQDWESGAQPVASMNIDGTLYQTWQEAIEREIVQPKQALPELLTNRHCHQFSFGRESSVEPLASDGVCVGAIRRSHPSVAGQIETCCEQIDDQVFKLTVGLLNDSDTASDSPCFNDGRLNQVLASTHMILSVESGQFISSIDPPNELAAAVAACENIGVWPVLAGDVDARDCMFASPIILYDNPQIAPQSSGDFFDGTEIDEMLALRVLTMTDQEKAEMRSVDERARQILERTESISSAQMMNLHGSSKVT